MSARRVSPVPSYRLHKQSGQAVVTLRDAVTGARRDVLLGRHGTAASRAAYARVISEWEAAGRQLPIGTPGAWAGAVAGADPGISLAEVLLRYLAYAAGHYKPDTRGVCAELEALKAAAKVTRELMGEVPAAEFGPKRLKTVRAAMVAKGWCRKYVNHQVNRLRRVIKWATEEELVPPGTYHALQAVAALRAGAEGTREAAPVRPVAQAVVEQTLPFLPPPVAAMVRLQLLTGARPGEICAVRTCDIDTGGRVWVYVPDRHKTAHHGHAREIFLGPKAQAVLKPWLKLDLQAFVFSPAEAEAARNAERSARRKTPRWESHMRRNARKRKPKRARPPADRYEATAYRKAIARGCDLAFPPPDPLAKRPDETVAAWKARLTPEQHARLRAWRKSQRWHPHQLRHAAATLIRREHGIELARIILGHSTAFTTEIYAEADRQQAADVMARIG